MTTWKSKRISERELARLPGAVEEPISNDLTQYLTTRQAAEILRVDPDHVNHLLRTRKVRGVKTGWSWLVYKPSIEKYEKTQSSKGRPRSREPQMQETK